MEVGLIQPLQKTQRNSHAANVTDLLKRLLLVIITTLSPFYSDAKEEKTRKSTIPLGAKSDRGVFCVGKCNMLYT